MKKQENKSRYAIMGILTVAPMSGYDIKKFTEKSMKYFWNENYAWIYPTLKKLEKEGLVTSSQEKQEGRPERRCYSLTEQGHAELHSWLSEPPAFNEIERNERLLKLFFGDQLPPTVTYEQLRLYREDLRNKLASLEEINQIAITRKEAPLGRQYRLMVLSYGLHVVRTQLLWCEESIAQLEKLI
jgi:PadR family transcriptional regulator AphA